MSTGPNPRRHARADQPGLRPPPIEQLWAPWRAGYLAGGDPVEGCPFCVLPARVTDRDRESLILHRGEGAFVVMNAYPYNPGHLMAIPYDHVEHLADLDGAVAEELWVLARRGVLALREALRAQGVNLGLNEGTAAGAGIADHVHLHVVPRWGGDTNYMTTTASVRVLPQALDDLYEPLRSALDVQ